MRRLGACQPVRMTLSKPRYLSHWHVGQSHQAILQRCKVVTNVAKPEAEVRGGALSTCIPESEVLQCPEIRDSLISQPSPFLDDDNAGGGSAITSEDATDTLP